MKSSARWKVLGGLLLTLALAGCGKPPAVSVTYDTLGESYNGKQVALAGYPRLPRMTSVSDTMIIDLHERTDGTGKSVGVSMPIGSGANQLEKPPSSYKREDLRMHASDGSLVGPDDKIRISGELLWVKDAKTPIVLLTKPITVDRI